MRLGLATALTAAAAVVALTSPASAGGRGDCKPYNGPYGFYDNPFCNGGDFTDYTGGRTIWSWNGAQNYWGWAPADPPPPRKVKRRAYE